MKASLPSVEAMTSWGSGPEGNRVTTFNVAGSTIASVVSRLARISKAGDGDVRRALHEAASALLTRFKRKDKVKTWGLAIRKRSSHRKATVAVGAQARRDHACDVDQWHILLR